MVALRYRGKKEARLGFPAQTTLSLAVSNRCILFGNLI